MSILTEQYDFRVSALMPVEARALLRVVAEFARTLTGQKLPQAGLCGLAGDRTISPTNFSAPLAVVFARDPEAQIAAPLDRLQHLDALTRAESGLVQTLFGGPSRRDRSNLSKEMRRAQLKPILLKSGTSSQI